MTSNSHPVQTQIAADNCEVLRARLAKYEDAEGNPISTIAEQAREIEWLSTMEKEWFSGGVPVNAALAIENDQLRAELAALKAQPGGVALEQLERHVITAGECPASSQVVLLSSIRRVLAAPAPSHSERVRHMVPDEVLDLLKRARVFVENWDDDSQEFMDLCGDIDNALAAAPSAGSQGGDV